MGMGRFVGGYDSTAELRRAEWAPRERLIDLGVSGVGFAQERKEEWEFGR